jgi:hypothetical protein
MRAEATIERRPSGNQAIVDLDVLIDELIAVIDDENALLASGMPASLAATTGRKSNLASSIEASLKTIGAAGPVTDEERAYLDLRVGFVQRLAQENLSRLAGAIGASRRRIAAVVAAVRDEGQSKTPAYGRTGSRASACSSSSASLLPDRLA